MRSSFVPKISDISHEWFIVDAKDCVLGRLSVEITKLLRGKYKKYYMPNVDAGNYVIIINAEKIKTTGKKNLKKIYRRHSGYPGGVKEIVLRDMLVRKPEFVIRHAIKGMMPKNNLSKIIMKRLFVYAGENYKQVSQKPVMIDLKGVIKHG